MKTFVKVVLGLLGALVLGFFALVILIDDTVTSRYERLQDARSDQLFERGWLPDILPSSSRDIRTSNDLDLNLSEGEFYFTPNDFAAFAVRNRHDVPFDQGRFSVSSERMIEKRRKGYTVTTHTEDGSTWVFYCKPGDGYCAYEMWLHRK